MSMEFPPDVIDFIGKHKIAPQFYRVAGLLLDDPLKYHKIRAYMSESNSPPFKNLPTIAASTAPTCSASDVSKLIKAAVAIVSGIATVESSSVQVLRKPVDLVVRLVPTTPS